MARFLFKTFGWTFPGLALCLILWVGLLIIDPGRDVNGLVRTIPVHCNSMIFGTSRSAQGIDPSILDSYDTDEQIWFNYSFNLEATPWCDAYAESIVKKISCSVSTTSSSTFVLCVDPWGLDAVVGSGANSWLSGASNSFCDYPTIKYAIKQTAPLDVLASSSGLDFLSAIPLIWSQISLSLCNSLDLHNPQGIVNNGWLPNNGVLTPEVTQSGIKRALRSYTNKCRGEKWPGNVNIQALTKTIRFIQELPQKPRIVLLRMPTTQPMHELENDFFPDFETFILDYARKNGVRYFNSHLRWGDNSDAYFKDGHHLSRTGAEAFSRFLSHEVLFKDLSN